MPVFSQVTLAKGKLRFPLFTLLIDSIYRGLEPIIPSTVARKSLESHFSPWTNEEYFITSKSLEFEEFTIWQTGLMYQIVNLHSSFLLLFQFIHENLKLCSYDIKLFTMYVMNL